MSFLFNARFATSLTFALSMGIKKAVNKFFKPVCNFFHPYAVQ